MAKRTSEQRLLLEQVQQIADGLARTFAPFCEVVVHDLLDPKHAVLAIHNNLSGREVGDPATELGLANPFVDDQSHLRPTLTLGILESLKLNQSRGVAAGRRRGCTSRSWACSR